MSWVSKVERQAYNNEEMWKNWVFQSLECKRLLQISPNSFVIKLYNLNVWYPQDITQALYNLNVGYPQDITQASGC
jgi:hypothetical protein